MDIFYMFFTPNTHSRIYTVLLYSVYNFIVYRIVGNFRGQADLHEIFCNAVQAIKLLLTKITVFKLNEFFTPQKLPVLRYSA